MRTMKFTHYLAAWLYCQQSGITKYKITKTGFREVTLEIKEQPAKKVKTS